MAKWRPIKTAPKDGSWILVPAVRGQTLPRFACWAVRTGERGQTGWWRSSFRNHRAEPTHWMPLPSPPTGAEKEDDR